MTSPVQSVVFNNTENWLGAGSKSGVIKVFDLEQNRGKMLVCTVLFVCLFYICMSVCLL